jgi:hypothetical protein
MKQLLTLVLLAIAMSWALLGCDSSNQDQSGSAMPQSGQQPGKRNRPKPTQDKPTKDNQGDHWLAGQMG